MIVQIMIPTNEQFMVIDDTHTQKYRIVFNDNFNYFTSKSQNQIRLSLTYASVLSLT